MEVKADPPPVSNCPAGEPSTSRDGSRITSRSLGLTVRVVTSLSLTAWPTAASLIETLTEAARVEGLETTRANCWEAALPLLTTALSRSTAQYSQPT